MFSLGAVQTSDERPEPSSTWSKVDEQWETLQERAALHAACGHLNEAGMLWSRALCFAQENLTADDPRQATSLANRASFIVRKSDHDAAAAMLADALRIWDASGPWVERLVIGRKARSSTFHLRMEVRHWAVYEARQRQLLVKVADEGRAAIAALAHESPTGSYGQSRWWSDKPEGLTDGRKILAAARLVARSGSVGKIEECQAGQTETCGKKT